MTIHILYIKLSGAWIPMLEPNAMVTERTSRNYPFGVVLYDSTETERLTAQIAIAELRDMDSADDLKWVEVTTK